ncbi:MAG: ABC transporter substrate-binding protein [Clostridia bacterium]|nr:ABC transporter substrate-binding protein [Clostridia bacterium]
MKHQIKRCLAMCFLCLTLLAVWLTPGMAGSTGHSLTYLSVAVVATEDQHLSPLTSRDRDMHSLLALCYEGLMALDDDGRPVANLVTHVTPPSEEGGRRWLFHLRNDVTFHNGKPLTSADVIATIDRIAALYNEGRDSGLPREERGIYANLVEAYLSGWRALDTYTVQINGNRGYYGLLQAMTFPILPAEEVANALPSGTGPYRIMEYEPGDKLWLTAYAGYRKPVENVSNIVATIYPNVDRALEAFDAGSADVAMTRSLAATRYTGSLRSFSMSYSTRQVELLLMHHNERRGILRDENVRRAIMAAIDRTALLRNIYQGMATLADSPVPPGSWLYDSTATQEPFDTERAKELLDEAGWHPNPDHNNMRGRDIDGTTALLRLTLLTYEEPAGGVRQSTANLIAGMLREVGIECTVSVVTYGRVRERLSAGNYDLVLCGMNLDVVPDPGFMFLGIDSNYSRYRNSTMDQLIADMRAQITEEGYRQAMSEVQHQFVADAPFMCLYFRNGSLLTRDTFSNVRVLRELELFRGIEAW